MKTVVLLSGGVDSAVTLALATQRGDTCHTLTVDYGQQHRNELAAAKTIAEHYRVPHQTVTIDPRLFAASALTNQPELLPERIATQPDTTYVPARNTVLLALAVAYAETLGAARAAIGCNADDAAAYPDCRPNYITAFRDVITAGTTGYVWIDAPLLYHTKRETIQLAQQLGVPVELTWSCYTNSDTPCGVCGACQLRQAALT
jgi:7-cyano-7-deazaguanine synthase